MSTGVTDDPLFDFFLPNFVSAGRLCLDGALPEQAKIKKFQQLTDRFRGGLIKAPVYYAGVEELFGADNVEVRGRASVYVDRVTIRDPAAVYEMCRLTRFC